MRNGTHRLSLGIAAAIAGSLIAVPAASGGGFPDVVNVVEHDTKVTIFKDRYRAFHGDVKSEAERCEVGRLVILFKQRRGADRKIESVRTTKPDRFRTHNWGIRAGGGRLDRLDRVYAKASREVGDGFVCRAGRSETFTIGID